MVTVVYLPGLDGTGLLSRGLVDALHREVEVVVASYPRDLPLDYPGTERIARNFMPQDRPFLLLGESFSGPIALSIAKAPPPGLLGVVLSCSFAANPLPWAVGVGPLLGILPIRWLPLGALDYFLLGSHSNAGLRAILAEIRDSVQPAVFEARIRAVLSADMTGELPGLRLPILYLRASEDRLIPRAAGDRVAALAPDVRTVDLPGPHMLLQTAPEAAARVIRGFIEEIGRRSG